jgi:predicted DNA-binding protein
MKRTSLFLPEPMTKRLTALSKKTGLPIAEHIRRAIEVYLKEDKK